MVGYQTRKVARAGIDSIAVIMGTAAAESVTPLPEQVTRVARCCASRILPGFFDGAMVIGGAI